MIVNKRIISATLVVFCAFVTAFYAPQAIFVASVCIVALLSFNEYMRMYKVYSNFVLYILFLIYFVILCVNSLFFLNQDLEGIFIIIFITTLVLSVIKQDCSQKNLFQIAICFLGLMYVYPLVYYLTLIRLMPNGRGFTLIVGLATGGRDLGSLIYGRLFRSGHVMLPQINPRKTYEGAIGGIVLTALVVLLSSKWFAPFWRFGDIITVSLLIGIFGQLGDLVESWLKRNASVVDSSRILPGQGGVLDTFDSLIFTAPVIYIFIFSHTLFNK